jgi:hypothetical protein
MNVQLQTKMKVVPAPSYTPARYGCLQRQCACGNHTVAGGECTECRRNMLQQKALGYGETTAVPPIVHEVLRSPGRPLDPAIRAFMEPRFGRDFSGVRVHTDGKAAESAQAVNAVAYTVSQNVVFNSGRYGPHTNSGRRLLAHELAHTIHQGGNSPTGSALQRAFPIGQVADPSERQADCTADAIVRGDRLAVTPSSSGHPLLLQRQIVEGCMAPSEVPGITSARASTFGQIAEAAVTADYCSKLGCAPLVTEYLDNPITSTYIAFLAANNPHLTTTDIITLAVLSQIELTRPDILAHRPPRLEFEEIKPNSITGRAAGRLKIGTLIGFYGIWSLPYVPGITYVPTPHSLLARFAAPHGPVEVSFRIQRLAPGLVAYDLCLKGDQLDLTIAAIIAIILLIIAIILSRGRIIRGSPSPLPWPVPGIAQADTTGQEGRETLASSLDVEELPSTLRAKLIDGQPSNSFEREAEAIASGIAS